MSDPLHGLDPAGLMAAAAMPTDGDADTLPLQRTDLPTQAEIAAAFPDLEILGLIGHGGMSAVFKARQPRLDRVVALKVLPKSLAATPGFAERFNREGRVLARLSHPSIVTVHDFGESGGFAYLIMEFVDGVNLRQAMRAGRFTPEQALTIIPAICDALQFAHGQGVLHRDIKPENILLDSTGKVKIADFGIAKIIDDKGGDAMLLTQSGAKLGTAPYMAPEQIEQPASVDHRADIYSLGVVFYEMLTGELPLGRFAAPSEKAAVGGNIDEIVFRALEKERARRQQSVDEFKTQVEGAGSMPTPRRALSLGVLSAVSAICAIFFCVIYRVMIDHGASLTTHLIPMLVTTGGLLLFIAALPLWLRLVPVNPLYGVRLPSIMASSARWFDVNAHFGKHLFGWSLLVIGAGLAGFHQLPRHQDAYPWAAITLTLVAVAASVAATLWWIRQHPVNAPARTRNRLVSWSGQAIVAVVIAMFIRSFIAGAYRVPQGNEPGVAKNSHWFASHLDTGFATGDLIIFEHESGQNWIARVVAREDKGLLLKRGGSPDEFFMPWDKIVGKMLFSHFTPDAVKDTGVSMSVPRQPVAEGTSEALDKAPVLRFTRLKRNGTDWQWPVYTVDGKPLDDEESKRLIRASVGNGVESQNAEDCWLELWFEHPDFDRHSQLRVEIAGPDGQPLKDRDSSTAAPGWVSVRPHPALSSYVISPGRVGKLPASVQVTLRYSIGPWREGSVLPADYNGSMTFGEDCLLAGFGDDQYHRAFVSWSKGQDGWMYDATARLKDGTEIGSSGWSRSGHPGKNIVESISFPVQLREVESFRIRSRRVATIIFSHVVVPPLP